MSNPLHEALEQARERLEQCLRDRGERDKVLAQATTGIAEIDAALAASPAPVRDGGDPLVEALKFYADEANWHEQDRDHHDPDGEWIGTERVPVAANPDVARAALAASSTPARDEMEYRVARWDEGEEVDDWSVGFDTAAGAFEELPHAIEANGLEAHPYDHVGVQGRRKAGPWVNVPKPKHDADCRRRKRERGQPMLCTCDCTDGEVAAADALRVPAEGGEGR